jgi:hypothetical protein
VNGKKIEAILGSPPNRDELVVQLFLKDGGQWGEIYREHGRWLLELYPQHDGQPWRLDLEEARKVIDLSLHELKTRLEEA